MIYRFLVVACIAISTASCISVAADGAVRLRGEAVDQTGRRYDQCTLTLHSETGEALQTSQVPGEFIETFVIEPRLRTYYVSAVCTGAKTDAKSATFRAGTKEQYEKPVDLGKLTLPR